MKSVEFFCCSKRDLIRLQKYCTVQYFTTVQQKSFITIDDKSSYRYQERDFYVFLLVMRWMTFSYSLVSIIYISELKLDLKLAKSWSGFCLTLNLFICQRKIKIVLKKQTTFKKCANASCRKCAKVWRQNPRNFKIIQPSHGTNGLARN